MTPRPFYRWKSFWLGLCVLVFLGWAWWDSSRYLSALVSLLHGAIWSEGGRYGVSWGTLEWERFRWDAFHFEFWRNRRVGDEIGERFTGFPTVTIPHGVVALSFLVPWFAWLFWHWKREQKKL